MLHDATASCVLILFFGIAAAYSANAMFGKGRYTPWERFLYGPVYVFARVLWRVEIEWRQDGIGSRPVVDKSRLLGDEISGGAILIANHRCSVDPFFVQLISGRRVHWMVTAEYFRHALFGPILKSYEAIPTNRAGIDTASTRRAIEYAKAGRFVGMFPEGRINRSEAPLLSIRPGAAMVAIKAGVPLIPIWIEGAPRGWEVYSALFIPATVRVIVGRPSRFEEWMKDQPNNSSLQIEPSPTVSAIAPNIGSEVVSDEKVDTETSDAELSIGSPSSNQRSEQKVERKFAIDWIRHVMEQSLVLGGNAGDAITMAGRQWLDR